MKRTPAVLLLALGLDLALGELPNRLHPVARMGRSVEAAETRLAGLPAPVAGFVLAIGFPAAAALAARAVSRGVRRLPAAAGILLEAFALKQTFAVRALIEHARAVRTGLEAHDLDAARTSAALMVSRDTARLEEAAIASAAIESLAENASDSAIAPWAWYIAGGLPAAAAYRTANTLDAMVGYREKGWVGTPSARLDDALNLVPARVTAALIALAGWSRTAIRGAVHDHGATPSPNSGWPMAAAAHGLGVRLEKPGHHVLNAEASPPTSLDIRRAEALTARALGLGAIAAVAILVALPSRGAAE